VGRDVSTSLEEAGEEVIGLFEGPYLELGALLTKYPTTTALDGNNSYTALALESSTLNYTTR